MGLLAYLTEFPLRYRLYRWRAVFDSARASGASEAQALAALLEAELCSLRDLDAQRPGIAGLASALGNLDDVQAFLILIRRHDLKKWLMEVMLFDVPFDETGQFLATPLPLVRRAQTLIENAERSTNDKDILLLKDALLLLHYATRISPYRADAWMLLANLAKFDMKLPGDFRDHISEGIRHTMAAIDSGILSKELAEASLNLLLSSPRAQSFEK